MIKNRCSYLSLAMATLGLIALATAAHADEIYSNFGPGDTFVGSSKFGLSGPFHIGIAGFFTPTQNYYLTSFDFAGGYVRGTNSFLFSIVADSGGLPMGAAVVSPFSGSILGNFDTPVINSFSATGLLLGGQKYWLAMQGQGQGDSLGVWAFNGIGATGYAGKSDLSGGNWVYDGSTAVTGAPAFRINGQTNPPTTNLTPEVPGMIQAIPVLLAVAGMMLYQRRKRAAFAQ